MKSQNLTFTITVDQTPEEAFAAINNVRGWWSGEIDGNTDTLAAEWSYRYKDIHYSKQRITELVPGRKVVWPVSYTHLDVYKRQGRHYASEGGPRTPGDEEEKAGNAEPSHWAAGQDNGLEGVQ